MDLDFRHWQEFKIGDIFDIFNGKGITKEEIMYNPGDLIAVQSGEEHNGCIGRISREYCKNKKYTISESACLTVARSGSAGFISFQPNGCVVGDSAKILQLKVASKRNPCVFLFLRTVLMENKYKYDYGRKVTEDKYLEETIFLPTKNNEPDWDFMESFTKRILLDQLAILNSNTVFAMDNLGTAK